MLEASFETSSNPELVEYLTEQGYDPAEDLVVAREISTSGKSQYFLYGRKVGASLVKELKGFIIDFHHQRDQQKLLNPAYQLEILDRYASLTGLVHSYKTAYQEIKDNIRKLDAMRAADQANRQLIDLYQYQYEELERAKLLAEEEHLLQQEFDFLSNSEEIANLSASLYNSIFEHENSSFDQLNSAIALLSRFGEMNDSIRDVISNLSNALDGMQESATLLQDLSENTSLDTLRLDTIRDRLDLINTLKHKHKVLTVQELLDLQSSIRSYLDTSYGRDQDIQDMEVLIQQEYTQLVSSADRISELRVIAALNLQEELEQNIRMLSIPDGAFKIRIDKKSLIGNLMQEFLAKCNDSGQDSIEYLFCANPGSSLKSLSAVASGGELSRILLAIKKVISSRFSTKLMILDEIDAGIGGKTAEQIAVFIRDIAQNHRILCITHLAQIAAIANQHMSLVKETVNEKTVVIHKYLDEPEKRQEIARMLSGKITEASLKHADEMISDKQRKR